MGASVRLGLCLVERSEACDLLISELVLRRRPDGPDMTELLAVRADDNLAKEEDFLNFFVLYSCYLITLIEISDMSCAPISNSAK